jgi:hypothetical protein
MPLVPIDRSVNTVKYLATVFVALQLVLSSTVMADMPKTITIQTPDGPVTAKTKIVEPIPQKIETVSAKQRIAIDAAAAKAKRFVADYLPAVSNPSLTDFDEAFSLWQAEARPRYTEQQVIDILGAYLGNRLAADFQMEWILVTDQDGTDYAVRGKKFEVISFPFASVEKRIESKQHEFMAGVYYAVKDAIEKGDYKTR